MTLDDPSDLRGEAKYRRLVKICRSYGVLTPEDPFPRWPVGSHGSGDTTPINYLIAPLFLLYDYSFRPDEVPIEKAVSWAREKNILCTDEAMLKSDPYQNVADWCTARVKESERRLEAAVAEHDHPLVLIAHFPLLQEHAILPRIPRFMVWCGTRKTEDWHLRFNARTVISGHLHIPCTRYKDGVRFEEVSLGYPDQWDARRERFGWQLEDHLRQILPVPEEDAGDPLAGYSFPP